MAPEAVPTSATPPTFLLQAEDDPVHEENALAYFSGPEAGQGPRRDPSLSPRAAMAMASRPTQLPVTHWPALAETWLHTIHMLGSQ